MVIPNGGRVSRNVSIVVNEKYMNRLESGGEQYDIVSKVAYLLGVQKRIFENENEPPKLEVYDELEQDKNARIIRNLCMLRTQLERNFLKVCHGIQREYRSMLNMPEFLSTDAMKQLYDDGVDIFKNLYEPSPFLFAINRHIKSRINNCRALFPEWLKWEYLSEIFIMPGGDNEKGTIKAAKDYYSRIDFYPYKMYMNWPAENYGNLLFCDKWFLVHLYEWNGDKFTDWNKVSDVGEQTKGNIYRFLENSNKCIFIVDCENSDPYSLCAAIRGLDEDKISKIDKIILFDDVHAASAWDMLKDYISIPVEYILIERLKDSKSLADVKVTARTCREFYANDVDSFVLASSDSDYWGLLQELPTAKFLIMMEHEKCSNLLKETLAEKGVLYCYIDDFCAKGGEDIKTDALQKELTTSFKAALHLHINDLMRGALFRTRIKMTDEEVETFLRKKVRDRIRLEVGDDGEVGIEYLVKR